MRKLVNFLFGKSVLAQRTVADDPLNKFRFKVTIPGLPSGMGFSKVGGLSDEVGVTTYLEGMYEFEHKLQGRRKVGEVTLERGMFATKELRDLYKTSLKSANFRKTIVIEVMDSNYEAKRTFKLAEAWISKWEGSDLDSGSDDVAIEKATIQFEYFLD